MHKLIKKYQWGSGSNELGPYNPNQGNLAEKSIASITNDWLTNLNKRPASLGLKSKSYFSTMSKNINPLSTSLKSTPTFKGLGNGVNLSGNKGATESTGIKSKSSFSLNSLGDIGGTASGLIGGIFDAAGLKSSTMGSTKSIFDTLGSAVSNFGVIGKAAGIVLNGIGLVDKYAGKNLKKQGTDANLAIAGYTPQMSVNAGGKTSFFTMGRKKGIDAQTKRADTFNLKAANATYGDKTNQLAATNTYGDIATRTQQQLAGGIKTNILSSKKGGKVNPSVLGNIANKSKYKIKKLREGILVDDSQRIESNEQLTNVIPEGALHARKNNYEGEVGEQVTSKGIPVITIEEGGKITQHAEIEHSEIIFNKKTSTQLEDWFKEYNEIEDLSKKKSLEIKCGIFLAHEILENTDDNTQLIDKI